MTYHPQAAHLLDTARVLIRQGKLQQANEFIRRARELMRRDAPGPRGS